MNTLYAPVKVILADDHEFFRDGLQGFLKTLPGIILQAEAVNGEQLVTLTQKYLPDLVLTDIMMPGMDGIEATRIITEKYPQVAVIALSMFNDDKLVIDMLEAGAKGYLLKSAHKTEIIDAINTVSKHKPYYCSATSLKMAKLIAHSRFNPGNPFPKTVFSEKEEEIICLICQQLSTKEIAASLHLGVRTIEGYRERILQKTEARNTTGIVIYAIKHGIFVP